MTLDPSRSSARAGSVDDRRSFLVKAAMLPAVAIGASMVPFSPLLAMAGAADGDPVAPEIEFARFATSVELALVDLYAQADATKKLGVAGSDLADACRDHHVEHAKVLGGLLTAAGSTVPEGGNDGLMSTYGPRVDGAADQTALVAIFAELEEALAATHLAGMKIINSAAISGTVASILPIEAQHAALWKAATTPEVPPAADSVTPLLSDDAKLAETTFRISAPTTTEPAAASTTKAP